VSTASHDVPCASGPAGFELTFRAAPGGPETASVGAGGCGDLAVRINGKHQADLQPSSTFVTDILKITGLNWKPVT
jgi:hypothetical protein